jgi:two-component system, cell cycle sensor histidine kinase and response regulator CckA
MSDDSAAPVRVLVVDDRAVDAELAEREVKRALSQCVFRRVDTAEAFVDALGTFAPDLILSDYAMPAFDGLTAVRLAREHSPLTPVIIVTAAINEDTAVECMKAGAVDYVIKEHIKRLGQAVVQALEQKKVRLARRQAEQDLRIKSFAVESSTAAICLGDLDGRIFYANDAFRQLAQCETREQVLGRSIAEFSESPEEAYAKLEALRRTKRHTATGRFRGRDGSVVDVQVSGSVVTSQDGQPLCLMGAFVDLSERRALEDSLRRNIAENRAILDAVPDVFFRVSGTGRVLGYHAHHSGDGLPPYGWIPGQHIGQALPEPVAARVLESVQRALATGTIVDFEYALGTGATQRDLEARVVSAAEGEALVIVRDITDRKRAEVERERLERQLEQIRKMESIGQLAGGIAHDFNNMLTVVLGNVDLMKMQMEKDHPLAEEVAAVEQAALRSKEMARQLLAFSRQQIISPVVLDLNVQIDATRTLLSTLIGEHVTVDFRAASGLRPVLCDPSQIDQVLLNLVVNARDAMPRGGTITIETATISLADSAQDEVQGAPPGPYVMLSVRDEGEGIAPQILPRIFEPFFTTKRAHKGTGLGLATVYGIVKQNGWFIRVDSEPGRGATFRLYMPPAVDVACATHRGPVNDAVVPAAFEAAPARGATILLVEDDEMVRNLTRSLLGSLGYTVLVSDSPAAAIARLKADAVRPDLLLTDVVMPMMTGPELRERLTETFPGLKTILMSGYTSHSAIRQALADDDVRFIQKPFTKIELEQAIRELLSEH